VSDLACIEAFTLRYSENDSMNIRMRFRVRVADLLERRGLKQKTLIGDNTEGWISNIMTGRRGVRLEDLEAIANILNVPPSELIRAPTDVTLELTPQEVRLVEAFRVLSGVEQHALLMVATLRQRSGKAGRPTREDV
jgi:transcriptional regulator with XRE-family HTH domain